MAPQKSEKGIDDGRVGVKLCVIYENQKLMSWADLSDDHG